MEQEFKVGDIVLVQDDRPFGTGFKKGTELVISKVGGILSFEGTHYVLCPEHVLRKLVPPKYFKEE